MVDLLTVETRDDALAPTGVVNHLRQLKFTERDLQVGGWALTVPATAPEVEQLVAGAGIIVRDASRAIVYSGPVNVGGNGNPVAVRTNSVAAGGRTVDEVTFYGSDDLVWISDRVAHPVPSTGITSSAATDSRSGVASSVLLGFIDANAGPGALVDRRVTGLTLAADPLLGLSSTWTGRWQNLLVLAREIATAADLGLSVRQVGRGLVASVSARTDRSAVVRFGVPIGNLEAVTYDQKPATATAVYAGGSGTGAARLIAEATLPGRRIERFVDRRDIAASPELTVAADTALTEAIGALSVKVTPDGDGPFTYGTDYRLGDLVGVIVDGVTIVDRVVAVETTITAAGVDRAVTLGSETATGTAGLFAGLAQLSRRVNQLERI